ncbi:MAG TPA: MutS family DNA mismatch repair protein [Nitrospira sp.]|nr:MutS family DNA mismatch repair protein [Nitrospira sp.]
MTEPGRTRQLQRLIARVDRLIALGTAASGRITTVRLAVFVAGAVSVIALYRSGWYRTGNWTLAGVILLFIFIAAYHSRLEQRIHRLRLWKTIKSSHVARLQLHWASIPQRPTAVRDAHLYAHDLDLLGPHSLLHLIDTTVSDHGRGRLADWLLTQPSSPEEWHMRRRVIEELAPRSLFRDRLVLESQLAGEQEINGRRLRAVLSHPVGFPRLLGALALQAGLAASTITLGIAALLDWLPGYWMFSFAGYALVYFMTDQGEELLEHAVGVHGEMERLGRVLAFVERQAQRNSSSLRDLCKPLLSSPMAPSQYVRRAARILSAISIKAHPLVHLAVNALGPWDLWYANKLRRLQQEIHGHLPLWLDRLAEIEAASALATFAYLHPSYAWPIPIGDVAVKASRLGHPLIPAGLRVANDLHLEGRGAIQLITGSNMSGKSTFLRTVGINVCLAQAGAPVCAERFEWTWCRLACCIRIGDSLDAGLSFFYAEVKRLKAILDATKGRAAPPVLFLIDEIFKGTNNRERLIGSRAYITTMTGGNGLGLISTHDLELTDLEKDVPSLSNMHFQETVAAGALSFDYKMRPGPCPTTNALRIMELEGLPIREGQGGMHQVPPDESPL